jgi:hypothetical protein
VPRLLKAAVQQSRFDLFVLALDMLVPPLSFLIMCWLAVLMIALTGAWLGASPLPTAILAIEGVLMTIAIVCAWAKFAKTVLPAKTLLAVPFYILWKIPLYFAFLFKPQRAWVRTERD